MTEQDAQQSIIDAAKAILDEGEDIEKITVRQIAERAGVGTGLINYHFKSKDNLLSIAIGDIMSKTISDLHKGNLHNDLDPVSQLKALMKELYIVAGDNEKLIRFLLTREIMEGNMQTPLCLIPLLRDIFGTSKNEMQLRIIALQILSPIQVTALNCSAFHMYSGINLNDRDQRSRFIDMLVDNLI
ncbi:transcriptional regulator [Desulfosporosinus orientis DSM 765]|uniref:Transcriptional regulator n=1 Tax=Desulfosporosinus orientis (strain ATCC 19365 / DSM 765 / NCIMB 8382 / VKM B-1628 / Singapore I) TaxID=768706 RepID=G7W9G8_DESOD|nr:TetR/AcrR family transcriptional regulator [Desulfosporosinus orientis]AET69305.1 transcriptional regulator [Desulfosporosinus orientis DSM 765]